MQKTNRALVLSAAALLLGALPLVAAHGDDHGDHDAPQEKPGKAASQTSSEKPGSYFAYTEHVGTIYAHIATMTIAWVFALPVGMYLPPRSRRHGVTHRILLQL
jgi:hypothetical protein